MTYQKTESQLITPECQERHPTEEPLPVGWQPHTSLIALHHITLQSYQVLTYYLGPPSRKLLKNQIAFLKQFNPI